MFLRSPRVLVPAALAMAAAARSRTARAARTRPSGAPTGVALVFADSAPDGSSIAFNKLDGEGFSRIFVLELSSGQVRLLTSHDGVSWAPSWSPDGQWIVYIETVDFAESHVWRISADGGEIRQLTSGQFFRGAPTWSPDGARIVFAREERPGGSSYDLYAIPAEGGAGEQLTDDPAADRDPCWAPF